MTETAEKKTDDLQAGREMERARTATMARPGAASLTTEGGRTQISDGVVAKIAGLAARSIPGVHSMGTGMARRMGQIKSMVPGGSGPSASANQGVAVEVGERQAAIDLDIVTWYGQ